MVCIDLNWWGCRSPFYVDAYAPDSMLQACRKVIEQYGKKQLAAQSDRRH